MAGGSGHTNSDGRRHLEETLNVGLEKRRKNGLDKRTSFFESRERETVLLTNGSSQV